MTEINGTLLAQEIKKEIAEEVLKITNEGKRPPHLAAVLIGEDPASQVYVRNKVKSCEEVGFQSTLIRRDAAISEEELLGIVDDLNRNSEIDGFIVQLPLPRHINEDRVTLAIKPEKDVDGFHPVNFGRMAQGLPCYLPATPCGIIEMMKRYNISAEGKEVVVIGRSNIVGTPIALLLSQKSNPGNGTVTICHSRTQNLREHTLKADILIAAIGRANFVTADMIKEGVVVIDVGINRVDAPETKRGYKLAGDVDFAGVAPKASFITPVPGGVGPMTVVSLLLNTLKANRKEIYP
ncbi:MAG: bifunctional 5,10-methylene-tetrahydrofolate dehydrogenase/5,10-methylene-tetrahydrofolate cyclohydrolase [Lewinella sp.]|nr:bifunctional 5,10-methylene-tetrahydrofolate dehydrogenase/5,10-methylene-tetrahydrofolate cyclohydrolase [Lewinella sp.]